MAHPDDIRLLAPLGELDVAATRSLAGELSAAVGDVSRPVLLDLSRVTFMDSTALGAVLRAGEQMRRQGRRLVLVVVPGQVERLLEVSGLTDRFTIVSSRSEGELRVTESPPAAA